MMISEVGECDYRGNLMGDGCKHYDEDCKLSKFDFKHGRLLREEMRSKINDCNSAIVISNSRNLEVSIAAEHNQF